MALLAVFALVAASLATAAIAEPAGATLQLLRPSPSDPATFVGHGGYSADGLGQFGTGGTVQAEVPAGSSVVQAYLYGTYFQNVNPDETQRTIDLDGTVSILDLLPNSEPGNSQLSTARADVTAQVSAKVGSGGGITDFAVNSDPGNLDGVALVVLYSNPSLPETTIAVLDGGSKQTGDTVTFSFASPVDPSTPGFTATMSLGIGFGYQGVDGHACGGGQFSTVQINGDLLTSCAGNYDDGDAGNGALITVGGVGDSTDNPVDPTSSNTGEDDELYDLAPKIKAGDSSLVIDTENPSQDDNLFLAVIAVTARASVTTEVCDNDLDDDGDGLIDENDPDCITVEFSDETYSVGEAAGPATVGVVLSTKNGQPTSSNVAVDVSTADGTATAPADYTAGPFTVSFPAGVTSAAASIPIVDDSLVEGDETVDLELTNPSGATVGSRFSSVLTIVDDDTNGPANLPPVVDAGPAVSGETGAGVGLSGSVSDPDDDPLTLSWSIDPACSIVPVDSATPTVTCSAPGVYTATLTADDGQNPPVSDTTTVTVTDPQPSDTTKPVCELVSASSAGISVRVVDPDSGLASIEVTRKKNAEVVVPDFADGTTDEQIVTATKIKMGHGASVQMRATDKAGNTTVCDPVIAELTAGEAQTFHGVPAAEHYLSVSEAGAVAGIAVEVNGASQIIWAPDGQTVDLGDMGDGTVTLRALGTAGSTATIMLWDGQ